jgi:hexosaminidase
LFSPGGAKSEIYTINYRQVEMGKPITAPLPNLQPGLQCDFFDGYFAGTKKIKPEPDKQFTVKNITFVPEEAQTKSFALRYTGYIDIPETGIYSFFFTCDDGGVLYIDDQQVIDNDGLHAPLEKSGQAALEKGLHPIRLDFVEGGGGYTLLLQYSLNGSTPADLPDNWFSH